MSHYVHMVHIWCQNMYMWCIYGVHMVCTFWVNGVYIVHTWCTHGAHSTNVDIKILLRKVGCSGIYFPFQATATPFATVCLGAPGTFVYK